jgi:pimeloyl-ACP methyl ester carboxylesterase
MPVEVILPRVDMDMERGKLTAWFAREGETVAKGQPLFEIETDKAAMEVDAPASGVLRGVAAEAGQTLPVGAVIGWIYAADEPVVAAEKAPQTPAPAAVAVAPLGTPAQASPAPGLGVRATPKARRIARDAGVDLSALRGSGPQGRVQARDVPAQRRGDALHREWLARGPKPPLVLIHGFGADLNVWRRWLNHFPPGRGALALDLPGHGRSPLAEPIEIERFAAAIAATLAEEGVGFAHIVAHSLGAAAAAALAATRPELVGSLTLIAPAGLGPDINGAFISGFLAARSAASLKPWLAELAVDPAILGEALAETTLRQRRDLGVGETQAKIAAALLPDGAQTFSARAALAAYGGPVKAIFGRDDRIVPASHARALPGTVAVHILPGVGHMAHLEARELAARLARDNAAAGDERAGS